MVSSELGIRTLVRTEQNLPEDQIGTKSDHEPKVPLEGKGAILDHRDRHEEVNDERRDVEYRDSN